MPVIINGSTGISGTDGSAGTPAVQGTDTNTGMFFPAADAVCVSTGGAERMRIDASGNVGIGKSNPDRALDVVGNASFTTGNPRLRLNSTAGTATTLLSGADSGSAFIGTETNAPFYFTTNNTERARITATGDFQFNSGYGSVATAFGCRAWVNFNGTGTVAIRASGNVSSITDNGTGDYTVNFTNAMPDANYAVIPGVSISLGPANYAYNADVFTRNAGSCRVGTGYFTGASQIATDAAAVDIAIFR